MGALELLVGGLKVLVFELDTVCVYARGVFTKRVVDDVVVINKP